MKNEIDAMVNSEKTLKLFFSVINLLLFSFTFLLKNTNEDSLVMYIVKMGTAQNCNPSKCYEIEHIYIFLM